MVDALSHPNATPDVKPASLGVSMGLKIEAGFRRAVTQAIRDAHATGLRVPVRDDAGRFGWLDADGVMHAEQFARSV